MGKRVRVSAEFDGLDPDLRAALHIRLALAAAMAGRASDPLA
jgi:hypothetical protein